MIEVIVEQNMNGKTVVVTGATDGIGKVTALELARMGARLGLVGRNPEKTMAVAEELRQMSGNANIDPWVADLSLMGQTRRLAEELKQRYDRLDVLVNNAGAFNASRVETSEGLEMTFALNHMSYMILTLELLALLKASAPSRIVNVSSAAHFGGRLDLNDLQSKRKYSGWLVYSRSKLANIYFTYELARRLDGSGVTVNALHPGFVATKFGQNNGGVVKPFVKFSQRIWAITPEQGAQTSIYLASSPEVEGVSGRYFARSKAVPSSPVSYDKDIAAELWRRSLEIAGMAEPQMVH